MKQIVVILADTTLDQLQAALPADRDWLVTAGKVNVFEGHDVATHIFRGTHHTTRFSEQLRLEIVVDDDDTATEVTDWVTFASGVGLIGAGRVSITSAESILLPAAV